jgi:subtilase family serine protease
MIAAVALLVIPGVAFADGPAPPRQPTPKPPTTRVDYATVARVCPEATRNHETCQALRLVPASPSTAGAEAYRPAAGALTSGPAGGLSPALLQTAYGYSQTGGTGQTVALVDAYNDPNIAADLATFDSEYGLAACTKANGCLKVVSQTGSTTALPTDDTTGWSVEESLDVEAAHSVCPNCHVLLVEANDSGTDNLAAAVKEAAALGATEISNSYSGSEADGSPSSADLADYVHPGIPITASAGDDGYYDFDLFGDTSAPGFPASYSTVIAVGGTTLKLSQTGTRLSEEVWDSDGPRDAYQNDTGGEISGATGGGCSILFAAPLWQETLADWGQTQCGSKRLVSDISAVADPFTGFDIYDSYDCGSSCEPTGWLTIGGTSLSSPLIASMYALAGGGYGVKYPALTLYGHYKTNPSASLYDVTTGGNGWCGGEGAPQCGNPNSELGEGAVDCDYSPDGSTLATGLLACDAGTGYDGPSGVGTPIGLGPFTPIAPTARITLPTSIQAGSTETYSGSTSTDPFPGGSISTYSWNWGDGSPVSTGVSPSHMYTTSGTFTITLTVTDNYGLVGHATATATVSPAS